MKKVLILIFFILVSINEAKAGVTNKSEIRGLFIHYPTFNNNPNWNLVAQTAKDLKQNVLYVETFGHSFARYNSSYVSKTSRDHLAEIIQAAHSRGIEVHTLMLVLGFEPDNPDWRVVKCDGTRDDWLDPCHPDARNRLKNLVEEITGKYDIDGFMFDYIRYNGEDVSVSDYCLQQFENDTGIDITGKDDVCPGGTYRNQFMEWRISTITNLVRDMRNWMTAIKPNLEFSSASFGILYQNGKYYPTYNRRAIAQDTANWVRLAYVDIPVPMTYTNDNDDYRLSLIGNMKYFVGGPEGVVPIGSFMSDDPSVGGVYPQHFIANMNTSRYLGYDGYAVWRYGGPGDNSGMTQDIRNYMGSISFPETFSIGSVKVFPYANGALISWVTDKFTKDVVEYNASPLFAWSTKYDYNYQCACNFPYWYVEHVNGTFLEDSTPKMIHIATLNNLNENTDYYYRVQGKDSSGTATSKENSFRTTNVTYSVSISGTVRDSDTGLPVEALVFCNDSGTVSDVNGNYVLNMKFPGSCNLTTSISGYKINSTFFNFPTSGNYNFDVLLEPVIVYLRGNLERKVEIKGYKFGTNTVKFQSQTDDSGNYDITVIQGAYDINFDFSTFQIKFMGMIVASDMENMIKNVSYQSGKLSFLVNDVFIDQNILVTYNVPKRILLNNSEIEEVASTAELRRNTYYFNSSSNTVIFKITPDLKTECLSKFECCNNYSIYYDRSCSPDHYCLSNVCYPKQQCPFACCQDEEMYENKSCTSPMYCVDRKCVEYSGYWNFDEGSGSTVTDSSGLENNGTINGATWTPSCKSGSCLSFDGVNDYVLVPDAETLNMHGEITIEAWVYPKNPWGGDYPGILAKYWPNGYLLGIENSTRKWCFWLRAGGIGNVCSDSVVDFDRWIHLAAVRYSNNSMMLLMLGTRQTEVDIFNEDIDSSGTDLEIGRWDMRYFNGLIDEVKIYKRALSTEEIESHASV